MSFAVLFEFSSGLNKPIRAPKGTLELWKNTVLKTERHLLLRRETWKGQERWVSTDVPADVANNVYCETVEVHNKFVRWLYAHMHDWQENPRDDFETIQPEDVNGFWFDALTIFAVPPERWTGEYYRARMHAVYHTLRGRPTEDMTFDPAPLTVAQAKDVVSLFAQWLDCDDVNLDCPEGYDDLYSSEEYGWCPISGAIHENDEEEHGVNCEDSECEIRARLQNHETK